MVVADSPYGAMAMREDAYLKCPLISTCHSFQSHELALKNLLWLHKAEPRKVIVTSDTEVLNFVRYAGFDACHVPITVDPSRFTHLPYPEEFTIGYIGVDLPHKNFKRIDEVGKELGVKVVGSKRTDHVNGEFVGREMDFYRQISCYVCATFVEKAPFPTLEAMMCGRPVVSTPILTSPPEVVECIQAGGGVLTDDLIEGVRTVQRDFPAYAEAARGFKFHDTASRWEEVILDAIQ